MKKIVIILLFFPLLIMAQAEITSFSPTSGVVGSSVTIYGSGFSTITSNNTVFFGGIETSIISNTSTEIVISVPYGASYTPISVYTNGLYASSSQRFNVTFDAEEELTAEHLANQLNNPYLGRTYYDIKIADMNGDGISEIVTSEAGYGSSAYLAIFTTSFDSEGMISIDQHVEFNFGTGVYSEPHDIAIGDVNGDGLLDVVVSEKGNVNDDFESHTSIFINASQNQSFAFESPIIIDGEGYEAFVQLQDINGDGKLDILTTRETWNQLGIYLNTSNNNNVSFANKIVIEDTIGVRPAFADLNGDGMIDMVAIAYSGNGRDVYIYSNNSSLNTIDFNLELSVLAGGLPPDGTNDYNWSSSNPELVDLDGDGKLEIVVTNGNCGFGCSPSGISVIRNTSTSSGLNFDYNYNDFYQYQTNSLPLRINISDINGDGKPDILTNDWLGGISILLNSSTEGSIVLEKQMQIGVGNYPLSVATADLNMDESPEIVVANWEVEGLRIIHNFIPTVLSTAVLSIIENGSNRVLIYPNPTNENITISVNNFNGNIKIEVYDSIGNRLQISNENTISLRDYAKGIYLLRVTYGDRVEVVKAIKD